MAADDFDYTAKLAGQLRDEHDAQANEAPIEQRVSEAQASHPRARVTWDDELQDVVIDVSTGPGR
jgi:hypothetical protein